jgi:PHD/YefM family antitoxin component YafN of YafNO toxin-antitoxin module
MLKDLSISEARHEITSLPERFAENPGAIAVTRRGKPVLAIMPWDFYESIIETIEILGDPDLMSALRQGIKDIEEGRTYSMDEIGQEISR